MDYRHLLMRIGVGLAGLVCLWLAGYWMRETYRMNKTGRARRLILPLPALLQQYMLQDAIRAIQERRGIRSPFQDGIDRVQFKSTIINNYLCAAIVAMFGFFAVVTLIRDLQQ